MLTVPHVDDRSLASVVVRSGALRGSGSDKVVDTAVMSGEGCDTL